MKEKVQKFLSKKINCDFEHDSPKDFVISQWQRRERCVVYLIYRWLLAAFYVFSVMISIVTAFLRGDFKVYFIYLTNLNLVATMIATLLGAYISTQFYRNRYEITNKMTPTLKFYWFLSICTTMYAILISFIYWAVLYHQDNNKLDLNNVIVHITNSCILIIDIFVIKHRARFSHFVWPVFCGCAYLLIFTWLYPFFGGVNRRGQNYIYPILNWNAKPGSSLIAAFGILFLGALIHSILVCIHRLRGKIHKRFYGKYHTVSNSSTKNNLREMEAQEQQTNVYENNCI